MLVLRCLVLLSPLSAIIGLKNIRSSQTKIAEVGRFSVSHVGKGFFPLSVIRLNLDERKASFVHAESTNLSQAISRYA